VRAEPRAAEQHSAGTNSDQHEIFLATNLNVEVHPPSAVASFRNHNLQLMIKKSRPDKVLGRLEAVTR
jgi:hypothetical protein